HQVRGELDAGKRQIARLRERPGDQRLGEAGEVLEQHVPVGEHAGEDELECAALPDDDPLDLVEDRRGAGSQLLEGHQIVSRSATRARKPPARSSLTGSSGRIRRQTRSPTIARARSGSRSITTPCSRTSAADAMFRTTGRNWYGSSKPEARVSPIWRSSHSSCCRR